VMAATDTTALGMALNDTPVLIGLTAASAVARS
jgi:hypothetical protein